MSLVRRRRRLFFVTRWIQITRLYTRLNSKNEWIYVCHRRVNSGSSVWWTRLGPESMSRRHQNSRLVMNFVLIVTRTRITSSTRHLESVLALTRHLIRLLAVRINSRVGDKNTLSWCLCSIKIEHAYTSSPWTHLWATCHALTTVSGERECMPRIDSSLHALNSR